jgi:hypothetical protein
VTVDIATLKNADVLSLQSVVIDYQQLVTAFATHVGDWGATVVTPLHDSGWCGSTADQVYADLDKFGTELQAADDELRLVLQTIDNAQKSFADAQAKLIDALDQAQVKGITVAPDSTMTWTKGTDANAEEETQAWAESFQTQIAEALQEADQADKQIASRLQHYTSNATSGTGLNSDTAQADKNLESNRENPPPANATPAQVSSWWNSLTPAEQQDLINNHPDQVGNLDGVPAEARDQANRLQLTHIEGDLQTQIDALGPEPPAMIGPRTPNPARGVWDQKRDALQAQLNNFTDMSNRLANDDKSAEENPAKHPRDYLLGISTEGNGRAILSFGNPDTAKNVSTYVPGVTTTLHQLRPFTSDQTSGENEAENALNVWKAASGVPGGRPTASIVWLNYDPPSGLMDGMYPDAANAGAPTYAKFLTGIRATHQGAPPHVTSIGDSYGSYLVSESAKLAADQPGTYSPPDDLVLTGSPGVAVGKASDLHMNGHVWAGTTPWDPVHMLTVGTPAGLGPDPVDHSWGGNVFTVADGTAGGVLGDNHTEYLTPERGGPSLPNIAHIVTGNYNDVKLEPTPHA